jgi:hypothetical protein
MNTDGSSPRNPVMKGKLKSRLGPGICYHDYLILILKLDAEWSRHRSDNRQNVESVFQEVQRHFTHVCHQYADGIRHQYSAFRVANHLGCAKPDMAAPEPWLYQPMFFVPFGHADVLALVLLDDLEPIPHLTLNIPTTIEEFHLGFCPDLAEFQTGKHHELVVAPASLFAGAPRPDVASFEEQVTLPSYPAQTDMPMLAFTQYKLDGLLSMGQTLLLQRALFKVMEQRIHAVVRSLEHAKLQESDAEITQLFPELDDLRQVRASVLDLQSAEEVGTLFLCRNFSTAVACIESLRQLTYQDLFAADPTFKKIWQASSVPGRVLEVHRAESPSHTPSGGSQALDDLEDNHVFRWTHTSLAVASQSFFARPPHHCGGFVEAFTQFQTAPGHRSNVNAQLYRAPNPTHPSYRGHKKYFRFQVGIADLSLPHDTKEASNFPPVPLASVVETMRENLSIFSSFSPPRPDQGRDVVDMATQLIVPVPPKIPAPNHQGQFQDLISPPLGTRHFAPLILVLQRLRDRLCYPEKVTPSGSSLPLKAGRLSLSDLFWGLRCCGVPVALRRLIDSLYQNFAILISDPFLFDAVLDLYDALATLHAVLTDYLPNSRAEQSSERLPKIRWQQASERWIPYLGLLDARRIEQLANFAQSLHDAMGHRLANAYLDNRVRDMAIDFRGGLNQFLLAADAPLKCGLGVVRKFAREGVSDTYDVIGGLTRTGFFPGARCHHLELGTEDKANLAYLEVDVPHVLHVPSYLDYLHESFHLVFETLLRSEKEQPSLASILANPQTRPLLKDRLSEIFALMLSRLFVFGDDPDAFVKAHLAAFDHSYVVDGISDFPRIVKTCELLLRLFLAYDALQETASAAANHTGPKPPKPDFDTSFKEFFNFALPLLRKRNLWHKETSPGREYCWNLIQEFYPKADRWIRRLSQMAFTVYRKFREDVIKIQEPYADDLHQEILQAMDDGRPLSMYLPAQDEQNGSVTLIDPMILICRTLQAYWSRIKEVNNKSVHLRRKDGTLAVDYSLAKDEPPWFAFQIDAGMSTMFCPVPEARRFRLRRQIAMFKTFWNIGSVLRGRRLEIILKENWGL